MAKDKIAKLFKKSNNNKILEFLVLIRIFSN